ncbi:glycosyltransferase family 39 protein [Patescibacteria group bacterium AH-259-L05]|nr:glycosyltransferase family 39 protein [Patescibacteria group bacterium AH-259-L05]
MTLLNIISLFKVWIKKVPFWAWLLIIAVLLSPLKEVNVPTDGSWYQSLGLNIYKGLGYVDTDLSPIFLKPPGFPFLVAVFFWLFDISIKSIFLLNRLFYIINPLIIYFLGKELWNKKVGLAAGLLVLSSYSISQWSALIHYDHIVPTFTLLSILLCVLAFKKNIWWLFVTSGIALAAGFLVKTLTILFFPFPILLWLFIKKYRTRKNLYGVILFSLALLVGILPWLLYGYIGHGELPLLGKGGGRAAQVVLRPFLSGNYPYLPPASQTYYISGLLEYYRLILAPHFILAPLFLIAWIFTFIRAVFKHKADIVLTVCFLLLVPIIYFSGLWGGRPGHTFLFFLLSYLILAHFLIWLARTVTRKKTFFKIKQFTAQPGITVSVILVISAVLIQITVGENNMLDYLKTIRPIGDIFNKEYNLQPEAGDNFYPPVKKAGEWILKNIPPGSRFLTDHTYRQGIYFYTRGNYPIHTIPLLRSDIATIPQKKATQKKKVLFLYFDGWWHKTSKRISAIIEDDLLDILENKSIDYVIVTSSKTNFESLYYYANPGFTKVIEFANGRIKIFKINKIIAYDFTTHIGSEVRPYLEDLKENNPEKFQYIKSLFFNDSLGWEEDAINEILTPGFIGSTWQPVYFKPDFDSRPVVMAEAQTASNIDKPINLLIKDIGPSQAKMKLDVRDSNNDFGQKQQIAYFVWDNKDVVIGSVNQGGEVKLENQCKTINFINPYKDPVIIAKLSTSDNPGFGVYIKNITSRSFDICPLPYADSKNIDSDFKGLVSYFVRESISVSYGEKKSQEMHNAEIDIADNTSSQYIKFPSPFDIKPVVLSSARIKDGCNIFNYQIENVTKDGFKIRIFDSINNKEMCQKAFISYMAWRPGVGEDYEVGLAETYPIVYVSKIY